MHRWQGKRCVALARDQRPRVHAESHLAILVLLLQGGLLCLAAIAVGLGSEDNDRFLAHIVPPVLDSFRDPDGGVRYYGLEALYNIAKVSRESFLRYFSDTFDSLFRLCADTETRVQARALRFLRVLCPVHGQLQHQHLRPAAIVAPLFDTQRVRTAPAAP